MIEHALTFGYVAVSIAVLLNLWRLLRGPSLMDRVLAVDTMVINVIALTLTLLTFSIFVQAILSWLGPGVNNRAGSVLWSINEPVLRPIRRFVPAVSGLDLSPLIAILLLQVAYYLLPLHPVLR